MDKHQILELAKCKTNPLYFLSNYVYIEEPGGTVQLDPYEKQKQLVNLLLEKHNVIVLKSRQIGISTIMQAFIVYLITFYKSLTVGVISRDGPEATDFVRKTRIIYESIPKWMQHDYIKKTEQSFELTNNSRVLASTVNLSNPRSVFRGKTITLLVIDEAAFIRKIDQAYIGMSMTLTRAHEVAKQKGIPHGIIVMSTPNGTIDIGKWYYNQWVSANTGKSSFIPLKIHYSEAPFTSQEWLEKQYKILNYDQDAIDQELELKFISSNQAFFEKDTFNFLQKIVEDNSNIGYKIPKQFYNDRNEFTGEGEWLIIEEFQKDKSYIISVDVAPVYGSCKSSIQITDNELNQVADFTGKFRITNLEQEIKHAIKMYPNCLLIIESNSYAAKLIEDLDDDENIAPLLFRTPKERIVNKKRKVDYFPGVYTDSLTRPLMMQSLHEVVTEDPSRVKSPYLATELMNLNKSQRSKRFSDRAMAYSFACYVRLTYPETIPESYQKLEGHESQVMEQILDITRNENQKDTDLQKITDKQINSKLTDEEFENYILFDKEVYKPTIIINKQGGSHVI